MTTTINTNDAEQHFYLHFYRMMARLLVNLHFMAKQDDERLSKLFGNYPVLDEYEQELTRYANRPIEQQPDWWQQQINLFEQNRTLHLPLRTLRNALGLSSDQVNLLLAAGMVEENITFGSLFAYLQDPLPVRLPGLGVMGVLLGEPEIPLSDSWEVCRPLVEQNLIVVQNPNDPRAEWLIRVPVILWDALRGRPLYKPVPGLTLQSANTFPALDALILPENLRAQSLNLPELLATQQVSAVVLRGIGGTGRRTLIGSVAAADGRNVLLCENLTDDNKKLIGPLATLTHSVPIIRLNPPPGEIINLPPLSGYQGSVGITLGRSGGLRGDMLDYALNLNLTPPDAQARQQLWVGTGTAIDAHDFAEITGRFLLTGGLIHRAAALASTFAQLDSSPQEQSSNAAPTPTSAPITVSDVQQALRALNRQTLDTLATPLVPADGWNDLVMNKPLDNELQALEMRCRAREALQQEAGPAFKDNLNRGVRAMFSGPSGTGKTLAARVLAAQLQMDLYRVDLAAVVNKYIGETERNLNEVLSKAEELDIILLLDEGDALMARRTDISNANDRYANLETNYLLQRLEVYEGIIIITTNAAQRIDSAFMRRLDVVVDFGKPDVEERRRLWLKHLPPKNEITDSCLQQVAARCALTGGQIRNAALYLALLGMNMKNGPGDEQFEEAVQREYRKAGQAYPMTSLSAEKGNDQTNRLHRMTSRMT